VDPCAGHGTELTLIPRWRTAAVRRCSWGCGLGRRDAMLGASETRWIRIGGNLRWALVQGFAAVAGRDADTAAANTPAQQRFDPLEHRTRGRGCSLLIATAYAEERNRSTKRTKRAGPSHKAVSGNIQPRTIRRPTFCQRPHSIERTMLHRQVARHLTCTLRPMQLPGRDPNQRNGPMPGPHPVSQIIAG